MEDVIYNKEYARELVLKIAETKAGTLLFGVVQPIIEKELQALPDQVSQQELLKITSKYNIQITPEEIQEAEKKLKLNKKSEEKPKEAPAQPQAKAEDKQKATTTTTPTKQAEEGSKPATKETIKNFFGLDDYNKEIKRRKELPDYQGGILNGAQNFILLLITMFANVISGGKATIPEPKPIPNSETTSTPLEPQSNQDFLGELKPTPTQVATTGAVSSGRFA